MGAFAYLKDIATVLSILSLLVVGFAITLKSGVVAVGGGNHHRLVLGNLSQMVVTLAGCLLILIMIQQFVGIRLNLMW